MRPYTTHPEKFNWTNLKAELLVLLVHALILAFVIGICVLFTACSVTKTIPVETIKEVIKTDTLYINNVQYDSIYVSQDKYTDRSRDTLLIKETNTVYKYKLLRDTVERVKIETIRDSIPYEVRITEVKEVEKPPTLFDKFCKACFFLLLGSLSITVFRLIRKFIP